MEEPESTEDNFLANEDELPPGWAWAALGNVAELIGGGTPSRAVLEYFTGDIAWLTPTEIPKYRVATLFDSKERITQDGLRKSSARLLPVGTVMMTSRASIGYVAVAGTELATNQGFASFVVEEGIFNFYLAYWLWANAEFFENIATGTTFKEISKTKLRTMLVPLAPLNEQCRIVEVIEAQFTRLDAGVATLKRLQTNLKRYKAAVLKAACEGKLVPQDLDDEPASELLARILKERREKWEADQRAKGKDPRKLTYPEPAAPDTSDLPELPEGWVWATVEQVGAVGEQAVLTGPFGSNLGREDFVDTGVPVLTIGCLQEYGIDLERAFHVSEEKAQDLERYRLRVGDLLFSRMASVGRAGFVTAEFEGALINYLSCGCALQIL